MTDEERTFNTLTRHLIIAPDDRDRARRKALLIAIDNADGLVVSFVRLAFVAADTLPSGPGLDAVLRDWRAAADATLEIQSTLQGCLDEMSVPRADDVERER